jgi:hypothetical protein
MRLNRDNVTRAAAIALFAIGTTGCGSFCSNTAEGGKVTCAPIVIEKGNPTETPTVTATSTPVTPTPQP